MKPSLAPLLWSLALVVLTGSPPPVAADEGEARRLLYVAEPGIRDYVQHGGHGVVVFDIDHGHQFVRRIPVGGLDEKGKPLAVKGVCASAVTRRLYVGTTKTLMALDLVTDKLLWERPYEGGCDRMAISPDGVTIYLPSLEGDHWHVVDALTGDVKAKVTPKSGAHNTIYGPDGTRAYLAGLKSPILTVTDGRTHEVLRQVGPFSSVIRPFTINGSQTLCFVNVNSLLGFEVGDLQTGKVLHRVEITGFPTGTPKRHGCPSHGIALTPDESELWVTDANNRRLHVFDARVMPPKPTGNVELRDESGWVTFGINGQYAYPSTGDVIETKSRKIIAGLRDEVGREVQSEKLLEIDFAGKEPVRAGNQFGLGGRN